MASDKVFHRRFVTASDGPPAGGPYSPAVIIDNMAYLSGSIGMDPATGDLVPGGIGPETEQALKNIGALLKACGVDYGNVIKATVFLADIGEWPAMNVIYGKYFKSHYPARSAFAVKGLPKGARVEIEVVAALGKIVDQD